MKKFFILFTITGVVAAVLTIYLNQEKKTSRTFVNHTQNEDEHKTMFEYAGWVKTT